MRFSLRRRASLRTEQSFTWTRSTGTSGPQRALMRGAANGSFEPSLPFLFNAADVCFKEDAETVAKLVQVSTRVGALW